MMLMSVEREEGGGKEGKGGREEKEGERNREMIGKKGWGKEGWGKEGWENKKKRNSIMFSPSSFIMIFKHILMIITDISTTYTE